MVVSAVPPGRATGRAPASGPARVGPAYAQWLGLLGLLVAGALVFWLFDALPFQDLPAHAGLIALRHRYAGSPFDQRFFVYAPHLGPYSLFRFLGEAFVVPLGPLGAIRAMATLPLFATPAALLFARWRLHGDRSPTVAFYGLALGFGFMTLLGFASYLLGVAVLLVALTLWLELLAAVDGRDGTPAWLALRRELAIGGFAPFVFVAHGHAFLLFLALAGLAAIATGNRLQRIVRLRAFAPALTLVAWVAWRERAGSVPPGSVPLPNAEFAPHYQSLADKLSLLVTPTLLTRSGVDIAVGLVLWALLGAALFRTARSVRDEAQRAPPEGTPDSASHARSLLVAIAGLTFAFLAFPYSVGWFGFVDGRLVPVLLLLALMAVRRETLGVGLGRAFDAYAPASALAMVALALVASYRFQAEAEGFHEVLARVPAHATILNLPVDPNSRVFTAHPFVHYDKLVMADRDALVSDLWFHQGSAVYPRAANPVLRLPESYSESDLREVDWPAYRLADWDYVLIRTRPDAPQPEVPLALKLDAHEGGWWLFRSAEARSGGHDEF